jgi:TolB-like protein
MPFANNSLAEKEAMQPLSKGLADMMTTELSKIKSLKLIERADLEKIIKEIGLSMSGMIDESSAQQAGKLLGADMLMIGSFNHSFGGQMRIDARLVKVETGETVKAEEITGKKKKLFKLIKKLSFKIAENLNIKLSKEEKKSIKKSDNDDLEALMYFSKGLDAEDKGDYTGAKKMYEKALKINKKYERARRQLAIVEKKLRGQ